MQSNNINWKKSEPLPILFAHIGWADRYDGTEPIQGNFSYIRDNPDETSEAYAFHRDTDRLYRCGVGQGDLSDKRLHIVFVARDPKDCQLKVVGLYPSAQIEMEKLWAVATCRHPILIHSVLRPMLEHWPVGRGIRRWAWRGGVNGTEHGKLHKAFKALMIKLPSILGKTPTKKRSPSDEELNGFEGKMKRRFIVHRTRENRLRLAKIRESLHRNHGKLVCEVPRCGFDFSKRYGDIGVGYERWPHLFGQTFLIHKWSLANMAYAVVGSAGRLTKYTPSGVWPS